MSDTFAVGDWAARVCDLPANPRHQGTPPPINAAVMVMAVINVCHVQTGYRPVQGLRLAGYPIMPNGYWNSEAFRKVPPPEAIEEPRRVAEPVPVPA